MDGSDGSQLFEDTSGAGLGSQTVYRNQQAGPQAAGIPGQSLLSDPMSNLAMAYGSSLASQGREMVDKNLDRFIPISKLKYYFAVDTVYVGKKLGLLVFPYMHEVLAVLLSLYLVTVNTDLTTIDLLAFSGYKYVGMIVGVVAGLLFGKPAYYLSLLWCCAAIFVFMIRTMRLKLLSEAAAEGRLVRGTRNQLRMYLTMSIAAAQPIFMYWLTYHLIR
ncbi:hypothetical protein F2P81_017252 [Scophthalmus maximus]|uniref:Protein YIF1 n=1 Tax=Scophthalmus maximus TaxID=52904 RepID=A0A6A4SH78_SCOMX|nr:hypothetical protein F2P81_017252 [Scophthalmus maximus]